MCWQASSGAPRFKQSHPRSGVRETPANVEQFSVQCRTKMAGSWPAITFVVRVASIRDGHPTFCTWLQPGGTCRPLKPTFWPSLRPRSEKAVRDTDTRVDPPKCPAPALVPQFICVFIAACAPATTNRAAAVSSGTVLNRFLVLHLHGYRRPRLTESNGIVNFIEAAVVVKSFATTHRTACNGYSTYREAVPGANGLEQFMSDEPAATTPIPVTIIAFNLSSRFLLALAFVFIFSSRFRRETSQASFYIGGSARADYSYYQRATFKLVMS